MILFIVAVFFSPFDINGKWNFPSDCAHPKSDSLYQNVVFRVAQFIMLLPLMLGMYFSILQLVMKFYAPEWGMGRNPNFSLWYSKESLGNDLVKRYAICSLEGTYSNLTTWSWTYSLRKWYLMGICLVLECWKWFLERLIALVLSHMIEIGWS